MASLTDWPTPDEERLLLAQLKSGAPIARNELAKRYQPLLTHVLACQFPHVSEELRNDATEQALIDFLCVPTRYDPTRAGLGVYLRVAARRDLLNLLERERRARRAIPLDSVAEPVDHRNHSRDDELTWDDPRLAAALAAFDADERITYELLLEGERATSVFASRLNLEHLPAAEQASEVKRFKDRVKKRLVRAVEDSR